MTEPAGPISFSLLAIFIAWLGPVFGPYALILFAAGVGSLLALSRQSAGTRWEGVKYVALGSAITLLLTGPVVWAIETYFDIPARIAMVPVAFVLGAFRDQVLSLIKQALEWLPAAFGAVFNAAGRGRSGGQ